jgi:hypothetical protein
MLFETGFELLVAFLTITSCFSDFIFAQKRKYFNKRKYEKEKSFSKETDKAKLVLLY